MRNIIVERAIVIFPQLREKNLIQDIRDRYDPLASKIAPHITLVFPFKSKISSLELRQHLETCLLKFPKFSSVLQGISYEAGNYLFLNIIEGRERIIEIHDLLYSGLLEKFLSQSDTYQPHMTVGHFNNSTAAKTAIKEIKELKHGDRQFEIKIDKITTEIILDDLSSKIDFEIELR